MPVYEFECPKCKNSIELNQKVNDPFPMCCEDNCNIEMNRLISKSSFSLKGGGWFKDGYTKVK